MDERGIPARVLVAIFSTRQARFDNLRETRQPRSGFYRGKVREPVANLPRLASPQLVGTIVQVACQSWRALS